MSSISLLLCFGCSAATHVRLLGFHELVDNEKQYNQQTLGGFSGIYPADKPSQYFIISDDPGRHGLPHIIKTEIVWNDGVSSWKVLGTIPLFRSSQKPWTGFDGEAIIYFSDTKEFLLSSEGTRKISTMESPSLSFFSEDGLFLKKTLHIPFPYQGKNITSGIRINEAFEALSITPAGKIIAILEDPLLEDGPVPDCERGADVPVLIYQNRNVPLPQDHYRYFLSPLDCKHFSKDGTLGISDVLSINESQFLILERAYYPQAKSNRIQIFQGTLNPATKRLDKKLVFDFEELRKTLSEKFHTRVDNMEAMTWGPVSSSGKKTLLLLSDDNFRDSQNSQIFLLELPENFSK